MGIHRKRMSWGDYMYKPKLDKDIRCPLEYGLDVFGGKWNSRIICVLAAKKILRYSELRSELTNITDAVLGASLKALMKNAMINRQSYDEIPPRVEYSLTEKGLSVVPILQSICQWSGAYHKEDTEHAMQHCQKCDYNGAQLMESVTGSKAAPGCCQVTESML